MAFRHSIPSRSRPTSTAQTVAGELMRAVGVTERQLLQYAFGGTIARGLPKWATGLLNMIVGARVEPRMYRPAERDIRRLIDDLQLAAQEITTQPPVSRSAGNGGMNRLPPAPPAASPPPPPQPPGRSALGTRGILEPPRPGEENPATREILTPQSSNVYSFTYDYRTSTLYVTYQASEIHATRAKASRGLKGKLGSTVGRKTGQRGPMYAYMDVPARVFERMRRAVSKGKFVWDELRVRGSVYGHQYRYQLVQGQIVASGSSRSSGEYIPRRATSQGFKSRSTTNAGGGRRGFGTSSLRSERRSFRQIVPRRGIGHSIVS